MRTNVDYKVLAENLRDALVDAGYEPTAYSGRGMTGSRCVAIRSGVSGEDVDLFKLGRALANFDVRSPTVDSLGFGIVAYWPNLPWIDEETSS